jgi:hypothetical protein
MSREHIVWSQIIVNIGHLNRAADHTFMAERFP